MSASTGSSAHRVGHAVWFEALRKAAVRDEPVTAPGPEEVLVQARVSLISAGTELVVYQGRADLSDPLPKYAQGDYGFPVKYAYQVVGVVQEAGSGAAFAPGDRVFVRHPHQDLMTVDAQDRGVVRIPDTVTDDQAAFLNLARVAHTAVLDVPPRAGDTVVVFGAGLVGLLTARFVQRVAHRVVVVDPRAERRELALRRGATHAVAPGDLAAVVEELSGGRGADLAYETSGAAPALQGTIDVLGQEGTAAIVSYYGRHPVGVRLAPEFHWHRLKLVSSHASVLSWDSPRWDAGRRNEEVFFAMRYLGVEELISHRFPLADAACAYNLLDTAGGDVIGAVFDYSVRGGT